MNSNLTFYQQNAQSLIEQYDSISFESVHQDWLSFLPSKGLALDVGAGSGRDARYLASKGLNVVAVEPAKNLHSSAQHNSQDFDITWLLDSLPHLPKTLEQNQKFDLILLSAVWMHLTADERRVSMCTFAELLKTTGTLVITLRHGDFNDARNTQGVDAEEVMSLAAAQGLTTKMKTELADDKLGRGDVAWQTIVFQKPAVAG